MTFDVEVFLYKKIARTLNLTRNLMQFYVIR